MDKGLQIRDASQIRIEEDLPNDRFSSSISIRRSDFFFGLQLFCGSCAINGLSLVKKHTVKKFL